MEVEQLRPRLWRWTAQEVASFALVEDDVLVLFDPLVPDDDADRFWRALDDDVRHHGAPQILLTAQRHRRSAQPIVERYEGAGVVPVGEGLPAGIEARPTGDPEEVVFWLPSHRALVVGDVLRGTEDGGLRLRNVDAHDELVPLLDLPVELVLLAHGDPLRTDARTALAEALS